jgi:hypothetical protein
MSTALTFRALSALPPALQSLARQHVQQHPSDDLSELVSELAVAAIELADRSTDAARVFARARSWLRRQTQDPAHYSAHLDIERHDTVQDDEPSALRRADLVLEVQQRQRVTTRRAQQIIRAQLARAMQGDLFIADEIAGVAA